MARKRAAQLKQLDVMNLRLDAGYQQSRRASAITWVKKHRKTFDPSLLGVIEVSEREGELWPIDGMARILLVRECGGKYVWAKVHYGLSYEQEADMFVKLSVDKRKMTPYQAFCGDYEAKVPGIVKAVKLARAYDYDMLSASPKPNSIRAYSQVRKIIAMPNGFALLEKTFQTMRECWSEFSGATQGNIVRALAYLFSQHGLDAPFLPALKARLRGVAPDTIKAAAYSLRAGNTGSEGYWTCYLAILEIYNKRRSRAQQITPLKGGAPPSVPLCTMDAKMDKQPSKNTDVFESLTQKFKRMDHGVGLVLRRGGATKLAARLKKCRGEQSTAEFARAVGVHPTCVNEYLAVRRSGVGPQIIQVCEHWGVTYRDLLVPKTTKSGARKRTQRQKNGKSNGRSNGHRNGNGKSKRNVEKGEVIFDATSTRPALTQL